MKFPSVAILVGFLCIAAVPVAPSSFGKNPFNSLIELKEGSEAFVEFIQCAYGVIGQSAAKDEALKEVFYKEKAIIDELIVDLEKCKNDECRSKVIEKANYELAMKISEQLKEQCTKVTLRNTRLVRHSE